jgi:hypothetical protein
MWPRDVPEVLIVVLLLGWIGLALWQIRLKHRH